MTSLIRPASVLLLAFTAITGAAYPAVVTGISQTLLASRANGSLVTQGQRVVGSELIGQPFDDPKYFWGRPSATGPYPYNGAASSGSNLGPSNGALRAAIEARIKVLREADPESPAAVPVDLVTASGSGLDPHISPAAALYQVERIARLRNLPTLQVRSLVDANTEGRTLGVLGEPRVNVLRLNLDLDRLGAAGG